jgi:hypothetical protein
VLGSPLQGLQDEQVKRTLQQFDPVLVGGRHDVNSLSP